MASIASKILKGKRADIPEGARCAVCDISHPLERSHTIPQNVLCKFPEIDRASFVDQDGPGVLYLCRNCHYNYEYGLLSLGQWFKIAPMFDATVSQLRHTVASAHRQGLAISQDFLEALQTFINKYEIYGRRHIFI